MRNTPPDWQTIWDMIPSMLAGEGNQTVASPAYSWWCESYEGGGMVASNMDSVLKDTSEHGPLEGAAPCARPPFNEMEPGAVWVVARPVTAQDTDGEISDEYLANGISLKGLTGPDGTIDSQYYFALRAFVAALDNKFMMKGTQEKVDLLTCKPQEPGQDGLTYVKMCQRREMQLNTGKVVTDAALRTFVEDCVERLRIKVYFQTRVSEQLRVQFPPPNKVTWKDLEVIVEVQDKLKNDAEAWILTFLQEITRRCGCRYSCWEAAQHGLDLKAIRGSIKKMAAVADAQHGDTESRKRADAPSPSKKIKKEVSAAERTKKPPYNNAPPPTQQPEGGAGNAKPKCLRWLLSNEEKDKYGVTQAPAKKKNPTGKADALRAEYKGMVAARQRAHVTQEETEMVAAPAVALGSTQKMRGFPVKTPEEFEAGAQIPLAPAAGEMQRKVQLMASLLKSTRTAFHKMVAGMVAEGSITAPREIETLVELANARRAASDASRVGC
ncbi:hypothetical protein CYMTET_25798 [Cymbomonas tetramitiformis]|uniref:Uncharacterized protein n=1 Tax=Cymbomonas tetramitiformis TaxID=36881 RepID=A0AAE0FTC1_9CHLO|nr:hypothetical protein CYMTET_25798 [Cymbomonas tetramitiformis]